MRVLLVGGAGFVGKATTHVLRDRALVYDTAEPLVGPWSTENYIQESVFNLDALEAAVAESDVVVHLVGLAEAAMCEEDPDRSFNLNVRSIQMVLEAARRAGGRKVVFLSSATIYGIPDSLPIPETAPCNGQGTYATHKRIGEDLVRHYSRQYGVDFVILRLFNVYGHGVRGAFPRFLKAAREGSSLPAFGVSQYRDFVYLGDVARAIAQAAAGDRVNNMVVNIGSGQGTQIRELLDMVKELYPSASWQASPSTTPLYDTIADLAKARLLLDYEPQHGRGFMVKIMREEICPFL